jgi:hypothetical protein
LSSRRTEPVYGANAQPPKRRTPPAYVPATWRCTLPAEADGAQALGFDLADGRVIRVLLDAKSVVDVRETLAPDYHARVVVELQSAISELRPSEPTSVPSDAVQQSPLAAASTA